MSNELQTTETSQAEPGIKDAPGEASQKVIVKREGQTENLNRFKCDCCKRILDIERKESFPCSSCGHGKMRLIEPKAFCCSCGKPIYDNADIDVPCSWKGTRSPIIETEGIDVTCPDCVFERLITVKGIRDEENNLKQSRELKGIKS
jgi:DNA-directed RNA polymerase subunit RPC12/RpoP